MFKLIAPLLFASSLALGQGSITTTVVNKDIKSKCPNPSGSATFEIEISADPGIVDPASDAALGIYVQDIKVKIRLNSMEPGLAEIVGYDDVTRWVLQWILGEFTTYEYDYCEWIEWPKPSNGSTTVTLTDVFHESGVPHGYSAKKTGFNKRFVGSSHPDYAKLRKWLRIAHADIKVDYGGDIGVVNVLKVKDLPPHQHLPEKDYGYVTIYGMSGDLIDNEAMFGNWLGANWTNDPNVISGTDTHWSLLTWVCGLSLPPTGVQTDYVNLEAGVN